MGFNALFGFTFSSVLQQMVGRQDFCAASHSQASRTSNFIATKNLMIDKRELEKVLWVLKQPWNNEML